MMYNSFVSVRPPVMKVTPPSPAGQGVWNCIIVSLARCRLKIFGKELGLVEQKKSVYSDVRSAVLFHGAEATDQGRFNRE
ncbi:MAG: hypothetical protein ABI275_04020 [Terrimesophilobacter sp.]